MLTCENHRLKVTQEDNSRYYGWEELETLLILGPHNISTPCLRQAMKHSVAIHFASRYGQYQGVACGNSPTQGHQMWQLQLAYLQQTDIALQWSIALVGAKIDGHIELIRNRDRQSALMEKLRAIKRKAKRSPDLQVLLGIEGEAAKLLWQFSEPIWMMNGNSAVAINGRRKIPSMRCCLWGIPTFITSLTHSFKVTDCALGSGFTTRITARTAR